MAVMQIEYYSEALAMEWGDQRPLPRWISGGKSR